MNDTSTSTTGTSSLAPVDPYSLSSNVYIYLIVVPALVFDFLVLCLCLYVWITFRDTPNPFLRARTSSFLAFFLRVSMTVVVVYQSVISLVEVPCIALTWTDDFILGTFFWAILLDCVRMFVLFNWAQKRFKNFDDGDDDPTIDITSSKVISKSRDPWWRNRNFVSNVNLLKLMIIAQGFYALIPFIYSIYAGATSDNSQCSTVLSGVDLFLVFIATAGGIVLAIQLRNVHDAYFLKNSLKGIGIIAIVYGLPSVVAEFLGIIPINWFQACVIPAYSLIELMYFAIPAYKTLRWNKKTNSTTAGNDSISHLETESSKVEEVESGLVGGSVKQAKLYSYLSDPFSLAFIKEYLIHYQIEAVGDYLNFWSKLQYFKTIENRSLLLGHASLIYQKFIKPDAYIYIDIFTNDQRDNVGNLIASSMEKETEVEATIFDDINQTLEDEINTRLFEPFLNSEYFKKLQEKKGLDNVIEMKITKKK